jgi:hypothetical protein
LQVALAFSWLSLGSCSSQPPSRPASAPSSAITLRSVPDGEIWFRNSRIQLRFDGEMYCRVFLHQDGKYYSISDIPPDPAKAKPTHFIAAGGEEVRDFQVDYKNVGASEIRTPFGAGRRLHLVGYAKTSSGVVIEKKLAVEFYDDFPEAALISATYRNTDQAASIVVTGSSASFFRLDAARSGDGSPSYDFWIAWGETNGQPPERIGPAYSHVFSTTRQGESALVDLWTRRMGMAVGDLSTGNRRVDVTVEVTPDRKVALNFHVPVTVQLAPNASFSTPRSVWLVHTGDAEVARQRYRELKRRLTQGSGSGR